MSPLVTGHPPAGLCTTNHHFLRPVSSPFAAHLVPWPSTSLIWLKGFYGRTSTFWLKPRETTSTALPSSTATLVSPWKAARSGLDCPWKVHTGFFLSQSVLPWVPGHSRRGGLRRLCSITSRGMRGSWQACASPILPALPMYVGHVSFSSQFSAPSMSTEVMEMIESSPAVSVSAFDIPRRWTCECFTCPQSLSSLTVGTASWHRLCSLAQA